MQIILIVSLGLLAVTQPLSPSKEPPMIKSPDQELKDAPCSQLTPEETAFAERLHPTNKTIFCKEFSPELRRIAMEMTGKLSAEGEPLSPDQAMKLLIEQQNLKSNDFNKDKTGTD